MHPIRLWMNERTLRNIRANRSKAKNQGTVQGRPQDKHPSAAKILLDHPLRCTAYVVIFEVPVASVGRNDISYIADRELRAPLASSAVVIPHH